MRCLQGFFILEIIFFKGMQVKGLLGTEAPQVAITFLPYTRPYQDIMRCFVCAVCESENQLTK